MSPTIWMRCEGRSSVRRLHLDAVRVVESQYVVSTRKLVDSDDEQALLEELIDRAKPPAPAEPAFAALHYLLSTPFRHPPLRNGSRFGARHERGLFYAARALPTALAEVAYYRLVFLDGTDAELGLLQVELSAFEVGVRTERGVDLTAPPFDLHHARIASKTSYRDTQRLGRDMRDDGVEAFVFPSARDPGGGSNVGLLEPCFASKRPRRLEGWHCAATRQRVEFRKTNVLAPRRLAFLRAQFELDGALPAPAV